MRDNVRAIYHVLKHGVRGQVYNIAGDNEMENVDVISAVARALQRVTGTTYIYSTTLIPDEVIRPGHDRRYGVDAGRIHKLGWIPEMPFEAGLEHTVRWYLNNPSDFVFERRYLRL